MEPRTVQELCRYDIWANSAILDIASRLTPEQFDCDLGGSFPSVHATLTHIMWAEWLWLERWTGGKPTNEFRPQDFPTIADLGCRWGEIQTAQARFFASVTSDTLHQDVRYVNLKGDTLEYPLWRQVYHVVNHSTYHRGQLTHEFRQLGIAPRTTDFLKFCDEVG